MNSNRFVAPEVLPDELDRSYLGALLRLNGFAPTDSHCAKRIIASFFSAQEPQSAWAVYISLATISGLTQETFLTRHSMLPWNDALERQGSHYQCDVKYKAERKHAIHLVRPGAAWCPSCALDDVKSHGRAFWRRRHQLPGVMHCDLHDVMLSREGGKNVFLKSPSYYAADGAAGVPAVSVADAEKHYADLLYQIGENSIRLDERALSIRLRDNMAKIADSTAQQVKVLAERMRACSSAFLGEVLPKSAQSHLGLANLLETFVRKGYLSSLSPYLLLLVLTEKSQETLSSFMYNEAKALPIKQVEVSREQVTDQDVLRAYIAENGSHTRTARRLQVSLSTIEKRLAEQGLPAMGEREFQSVWAFLIEGRSFAESVSQSGLGMPKFESLVRVMASPFAVILTGMNRSERHRSSFGPRPGTRRGRRRLDDQPDLIFDQKPTQKVESSLMISS
jgi:hypothetical protein